MAGIGMISVRQEGNPVQCNLVNWCWVKLLESDTRPFILDIFKYSTTLEKKFSGNNYLNPMCTIKLKTRLH